MRIKFRKSFVRMLDKAPVKIRAAFYRKIEIFQSDPFCPALRNHKLAGRLNGCRSIDITGDWRAIYEDEDRDLVIFLLLGTHGTLYK